MDHEYTMLGKSASAFDEEKLRTDSTIIPIQLLDRPSPYKVYRHQDYERVGRLSQNRAKDSKGTRYCLSLKFFVCFFVLKIHILYTWSFFSHGTNQKRGNLILRQPKKTRREKEDKKAKKGTIASCKRWENRKYVHTI